jgi:hypothetical protein
MTDRRRIVWNLGSAVVLLAGGVGLAAAKLSGAISADLMMRGVMVMIGLVTVGNANLTPKTAGSKAPSAHQQSSTRFFGWAMALAGLVWVSLWAFAPIRLAMIGAPAAVVSVLVVWIILLRRRRNSDGVATPL